MSYSFSVTAATKAAACRAVSAELDKVVESQPVHAADRAAAQATAETFIIMLQGDPDMDIHVSMHGSIVTAEDGVRTASVGVTANLTQRA